MIQECFIFVFFLRSPSHALVTSHRGGARRIFWQLPPPTAASPWRSDRFQRTPDNLPIEEDDLNIWQYSGNAKKMGRFLVFAEIWCYFRLRHCFLRGFYSGGRNVMLRNEKQQSALQKYILWIRESNIGKISLKSANGKKFHFLKKFP